MANRTDRIIDLDEDLMTVADAAREWGHSRTALMQHVARGRLKTLCIAGHYIIRRSDFNAFLAERASRAERRVAC